MTQKLSIVVLAVLIAGLLSIAPPAQAQLSVCYECVTFQWPNPGGGTEPEVFHYCLYLAGDGATECWEVNDGLGCVVWFDGWCWADPPSE